MLTRRMSKSRKNKIASCDKLWSAEVVKRDGGICQKCGEFGDNPHHVIPKGGGKFGTRWILANGLTLCTDCHINDAHAYPELFESWFIREFPCRWEVIQKLKHAIKIDLDEAERVLKNS